MPTKATKLFILLFLFSLKYLTVFAQEGQTIKGNIFDETTQVPLPGVNIIVTGSNPLKGATTDEKGKFKITGILPGRYNLKITCLGFKDEFIRELLVSSGKEIVLNIGLKEVVTKLNEVTVSGQSRKDLPINSMATISARTFSVEEAGRYAGGFKDPGRLASSFAGVSTGTMDDNGIVVRGNAPKGILWRLEGIQIPNPNHMAGVFSAGGGVITIFSGQMLANSDFFTGAFPAEYGNTLAGVFDMKLRVGNNEKREYALQAGTLGVDISSEGPFVNGKKASYLFNYRFNSLASVKGILPKESLIPFFQDLSFHFNFPTEKAGSISVWGIGGLSDANKITARDKTKWRIEWDRTDFISTSNMGAAGISHKIILGKKSFIHTTLATSANKIELHVNKLDSSYNSNTINHLMNTNGRYTLNSVLNHKFNASLSSRAGVVLSRLEYNYIMQEALIEGAPLYDVIKDKGNSELYQSYFQLKNNFTDNLSITAGVHAMYFALNKKYAIEPRAGLNYQISNKQTLSLGYGNHSQMELLSIYLANINTSQGKIYPNKNLDYTKAHHFVIGYDFRISENLRLKLEPYYQYIYNAPVIPDSSVSLLNFKDEWFINEKLVNKGKGTNMGIDITFERFLHNNFYYMATASIFDSKYQGGDGKWHNTRFNKNYVFNILGGKEWIFTWRNIYHIAGVNAKITYMGGERYTSIDYEKSAAFEDVIYDYSRIYEEQAKASFYCDLTITLKRNRQKFTGSWELHIKNLFQSKEFYGHSYSYKKGTVVQNQLVFTFPAISYKIEF